MKTPRLGMLIAAVALGLGGLGCTTAGATPDGGAPASGGDAAASDSASGSTDGATDDAAVCTAESDPCTAELCGDPTSAQSVPNPWDTCSTAVKDALCKQTADIAALKPAIEQCTAPLLAGFRALDDTDQMDGLWQTFDACLAAAVGCPPPAPPPAADSMKFPIFTSDACKQTEMRACNDRISDAFERDLSACIAIALGSFNPETLRLCYIGSVVKRLVGRVQCFKDATCADGLLCCHEMCLSGASDNNNCGMCDNKCGAGQQCKMGMCLCGSMTCKDCCQDMCVDFQSDSANCGACGHACATGESCASGTCTKDDRPLLQRLLVDEYHAQLRLLGSRFGDVNGTVTVGGTPAPIVSWTDTTIVCTLSAGGPGASGDVVVEVPAAPPLLARTSNARQLTEWDVPVHYQWTKALGLAGWQFDGTATFRFRADVGADVPTPGVAPTFPVRGMAPIPGAVMTVTGTGTSALGSTCNYALSGSGAFAVGGGGATSLLVGSMMQAAGDGSHGALGLAFGAAAADIPFRGTYAGTGCPPGGPNPVMCTFGNLEGALSFPSPLEDGTNVGPLLKLDLMFSGQLVIAQRTYTTAMVGGALTVEWSAVTPLSPPKPTN